MTLSEFKSWFEGFTENMEATPNKKQWARIQKRVEEIDNVAITHPVYIDRYIRPYSNYPFTQYFGGLSEMTGNTAMVKSFGDNLDTKPYEGDIDMKEAGRLEAVDI